MRHLARDADLVAEAFERLLVVRDGFGEELERDRLVEREVVGAVDLAHPAFAEHGDDAVASAEQLAGSEPSLRAAAGVAHRRRCGSRAGELGARGALVATVRVADGDPMAAPHDWQKRPASETSLPQEAQWAMKDSLRARSASNGVAPSNSPFRSAASARGKHLPRPHAAVSRIGAPFVITTVCS